MNYSEPLINQLSSFLSSVGFGFVICLLYMTVKAVFRLIGNKKRSVMAGDAVFSFIAANVSFFFMMINNDGLVRLNLIIGQGIGAAVMYFSFGRFVMKYIYGLCDVIRGIIANLLYPVRVYIRAFYNTAKKILSKNKEKSKTDKRKIKNIAKILLKSENK